MWYYTRVRCQWVSDSTARTSAQASGPDAVKDKQSTQ
nr:MAG TPA: hypothetical protein [Caudoviricetes sp.]